jgi:hypothetical protein
MPALWLTVSTLVLGLAGSTASASAEGLYVFFPSAERAHVLQKGISGLAPGLGVTAFGRYADFEDEVKARPPEAILSLPEVIEALEGYSIALASSRNGEPVEPLFLLSLGKPPAFSGMGDATIGAVDFLGRKGMRKYVAGLFQPPPAIKTVAKVEDLLPLLTFRMADAILVTAAQADYFREVSQLAFVKTPVPDARAGTVCLAVRNGAAAPKAMRAMQVMDASLRKHLGDVQWK